jgi:hypothetical protein
MRMLNYRSVFITDFFLNFLQANATIIDIIAINGIVTVNAVDRVGLGRREV